jgi:hypothetical protein
MIPVSIADDDDAIVDGGVQGLSVSRRSEIRHLIRPEVESAA